MMKTLTFALISSTMLLVAACATSTPYGPATESAFGFAEQRVENNRWKVSFSGNSLTDLNTVDTYLLYRAAELTRNEGYDYFIMVDRKTDEDREFHTSTLAPPRPYYSYRFYHPAFGWGRYDDPFFDDMTTREITRYEALAEIVMGNGPKPAGDKNAYMAEDVLINLAPQIQRAVPN